MDSSFFEGKTVLVTGVCGTIGEELVRQLLGRYRVGRLIGLDHNENGLIFLESKVGRFENARYFLADVRDQPAMIRWTRGVDLIFHAAANKHVSLCEYSPLEAVRTNILGVENIIYAAISNGVERVLLTSSDKAVNPTNVMGTSKLMGEKLMTAASGDAHLQTTFVSTRFGNVLGSRGSVIPIFLDQIRGGGPVTLTDPGMTRFIMSLQEAIRLTIESMAIGRGGDVLITKMPAIRISDLAEIMVRECALLWGFKPADIAIEVIGSKPGEKVYEELMNEEEVRRAIELETYFVINPALATVNAREPREPYPNQVASAVENAYNSAVLPYLSHDELADFLHRNRLIPDGTAATEFSGTG